MDPVEVAVRELIDVYHVLASDVDAARQYGQQQPTPFAHRTLFRTHFALVEGLSHQLRRVARIVNEHFPGSLDEGEVDLLRDYRYRLNDKGEPAKAQEFQRTLPSTLFAIRCYSKVYGIPYEITLNDPGYKAFKELVGLRNRLMHPKCKADLDLTEAQIRNAAEAATWWKQTIIKLIEAAKANSEV
jgi:hypothetical protein